MENLHLQVESLEQKRSKWLIINLIGFCIWDGARIVDNYLLEDYTSPIFTGIVLLGWLIWLGALIQLIRVVKEMRSNKMVTQILNDELIELNRFKAWRAALLMVVLTQVGIIFTTLFLTEISGILAAELSIFVAVISAIGGFYYYNHDTDA